VNLRRLLIRCVACSLYEAALFALMPVPALGIWRGL